MSLSTLGFRRWVVSALPLVIWAGLAISAYYVASGLAALAETSLLTPPDVAPRPVAIAETKRPRISAAQKARIILERNPFDSLTGPLGMKPPRADERQLAAPPVDPLAAPRCEGIHVFTTLESSDSSWSSAVIQAPGEPRGVVRRVGDRIGERSLLYIGFNPAERSPAVWLADATSLCQCVLFGESPRSRPTAKPPPVRAPTPPAPTPLKPGPAPVPLPPDLAGKIARVTDREFYVDRSAVDAIVSRFSEFIRGTRVIPIQQGGRVIALEMRKIRGDGLLGRLGLREGDRIETINGFALSSPEQALRAYARLRTATSIGLKIQRGGRPMTIDYRVR